MHLPKVCLSQLSTGLPIIKSRSYYHRWASTHEIENGLIAEMPLKLPMARWLFARSTALLKRGGMSQSCEKVKSNESPSTKIGSSVLINSSQLRLFGEQTTAAFIHGNEVGYGRANHHCPFQQCLFWKVSCFWKSDGQTKTCIIFKCKSWQYLKTWRKLMCARRCDLILEINKSSCDEYHWRAPELWS
jgi:hypothetical protein